MFSRTTIASSMSRPMHSDSAISVRKLSVKPNTYTAMKVAITEIGSVSPVMIVLRQECRNRNTMKHGEDGALDDRHLDAVERFLDLLDGVVDDVSSTSVGSASSAPRPRPSTPRPISTMLASCDLEHLERDRRACR